MELESAIGQYWAAKKRDFSACTVADYTVTFRRLSEFLGAVELENITSSDVNRFLNAASDEYQWAAKTRLNAWIALSSLWSWAEKALDVTHIIRGKVERPKASKQGTEPYSQDEITALLRACDMAHGWDPHASIAVPVKRPSAVRDRAIILVLLDSGIRASELCALRLRDWEPQQARLIVELGKGNKRRAVFIGARAKKALVKYLAGRRDAHQLDPLFVTRTGDAMTRNTLLQLVERIGARAAVVDPGIHRFRATFATQFLRNGGNVMSLQAALGHESLEMSRHYAKISGADLESQMRGSSPADRWAL